MFVTKLLRLDEKSKHTRIQKGSYPPCECLSAFPNRPHLDVLYGFLSLKSRKKPVKISALACFQSFCFYLRTLSDGFGFWRCKYRGYKMCLSFRRPQLLDASLDHRQPRNLFLQVIAREVSGARQSLFINRQLVVSKA
jgi:hypothetical protein